MTSFAILLVMSLLAFIIEVITKRGLSIWFGFAFLITAFCSLVISTIIPLIIIYIASLVFFMFTFGERYRTRFIPAREIQTLDKNLVGKEAIVTKDVYPVPDVRGRIIVDNQQYLAITHEHQIIKCDSIVRIVEVDESKVYVKSEE